jgi:transposase InsO family protein
MHGRAICAHQARGCLFRSNTDTEVLLWLYELCGPAMLSRLSGARLLACLIVAPQRGYDEPGILSFDGRRLWVLTVVDIWSQVCPVIRVCRSATAMEVIDALEQARRQHGVPTTIRVDQGSQFTSKELDLWAYANGITLDFSRPGKPTDNASAESSNATVRLSASVGTGRRPRKA